MKLNELGATVAEIKTQVTKVFGEQQTVIDQAKAKIVELEGKLENVEVPTEVTDAISDLKSLVQTIDDQNPDVTEQPVEG